MVLKVNNYLKSKENLTTKFEVYISSSRNNLLNFISGPKYSEQTGLNFFRETPVFFQDQLYFRPYHHYQSKIHRCAFIMAHFGKKIAKSDQ